MRPRKSGKVWALAHAQLQAVHGTDQSCAGIDQRIFVLLQFAGGGELAEALEQHLLGLAEGSRTTFALPAGSVFGEADPARQQWIASSALAEADEQPAERHVGEVLQFTSPDGQARMAATVAAVDEAGQRVLLDFNHPLAGQALTFEVQIIGIL